MRERCRAVVVACRRWLRQLEEPLFLLALCAMAGVLMADFFLTLVSVWIVLVILAAAAALRWRATFTLYGLTFVVFGLAHVLTIRDPLREEVARHLAPGAAMPGEVTGLVTDAPDGSGEGNWRFPLAVESLTSRGRTLPASGEELYVRLYRTEIPPRYGDRVHLTGLIERPDTVRNPGEFDFVAFLYRQDLAAAFESSAEHAGLRILEHDQGSAVVAAALRCREWIAGVVSYDLEGSPDTASVIRAMVLGSRERTPQDIEDAFRISGTMHIFSVSGLHVGLFAAMLWFTFRALRLPRAASITLTLTFVFFYVFVTGLRASAWRAALMTTLVITAPLANREGSLFNGIGAAALLLLGWNTQQLFQPGFVLSFGVLLAIAALHRPFLKATRPFYTGDPFLPDALRTRPQRTSLWVRHRLFESMSVSAAATLGTLPLMIGYFRLITPVGLLANLFLVMLAFAVLACACLSMLAVLGGQIWLSALLNNTNCLLAGLCVTTAKFFAAMPLGHVRVDPARLWRGSLCEVSVLALDSGGAATHIDTPEGRHYLIDDGGSRHASRTMRPHLERTPVRTLDGLFLTHRDRMHTGGTDGISGLFPPVLTWQPAADGLVSGVLPLATGNTVTLDGETSVRVLFPPQEWQDGLADNRSLVLRLECRGYRILFMGDSGFITEKALLESGEDLRADVLVKNRHASDFSGLPEFLNAVQPGVLVYSNNRYPEAERVPADWIAMVRTKNIHLFDQAHTGAVILRLSDAGLEARAWVTGEKFTLPPHRPLPWSAPDRSGDPVVR